MERSGRVIRIALLLRTQRLARAQLAAMFDACKHQIQRGLFILRRAGLFVRRYYRPNPSYEVSWPELERCL